MLVETTLGALIAGPMVLAVLPVIIIAVIGWPIHLVNEHFRHARLRRQDEIRDFNRAQEEMELYNEIHYGE